MGGGLPEREVVEVLILAIHFLTNFFHEILYDLLINSIDCCIVDVFLCLLFMLRN